MLMRRAFVVVLSACALLGACGGSEDRSKTSKGARASCASDAECVVTDTSNCCAPCLEAPHAIPTLAFEQQKNRCAVVDCAPASDRIECPKVAPKAGFVAKCNDGTCVAVKP